MRAFAKAILGSDPVVAASLRWRHGQSIVLAWHNIVPPKTASHGDRSLHLDFDTFRRQLDGLPSQLRIVPVSDLLSGTAHDSPWCALTFDDAYRGALHLALPELAARRLPATVFVAPGLLGASTPWWDAYAAGPHGLLPGFRDAALSHCGGDQVAVTSFAAESHLSAASLPETHRLGTLEELQVSASLPGISLGAHSWSHPNFGVLPAERYDAELARPLQWLRERFPEQVIPWFAWPYGLSSTAAEAAAARVYRGLLRVDGGWSGRVIDPFRVPRLNVPSGMSPAALRANLVFGRRH